MAAKKDKDSKAKGELQAEDEAKKKEISDDEREEKIGENDEVEEEDDDEEEEDEEDKDEEGKTPPRRSSRLAEAPSCESEGGEIEAMPEENLDEKCPFVCY